IDYDSLSYVQTPPDSLFCPVCRALLTTPLQTKMCNHVFCARCISRALSDKLECPIDRTPMRRGMEDCSPAPRLLESLVDELLVYCPFKVHGCPVTVSRGLLKYHIRDACDYVLVPCANPQCDKFSFRKDIAAITDTADSALDELDDKLTCAHTTTVCEHCGDEVLESAKESHLDECSALSHTCTYCTSEFSAVDMAGHRLICLEEPVNCSAHSLGCTWHEKRIAQPAHEASCIFNSLRPYLAAQDAKLAALQLENASLRERVTAFEQLPINQGIEPVLEISSEYERDRAYLFQQLEQTGTHIENLSNAIASLETRQAHVMMNESLRNKDELAMLRGGLQAMRLQFHHFLQQTR
ncbi:hypothetical protein BCR37DRAFT_340514, partial [Protomyces lactucae-debilis]